MAKKKRGKKRGRKSLAARIASGGGAAAHMGKGRKRGRRHGRQPTAKAKKAYYKNIIKGYKRLKRVVSQHAPNEL